jgi:hypothetical protein
MILLTETKAMAVAANDSLILLPLDRIRNPPAALETWPEGYEDEEMMSES